MATPRELIAYVHANRGQPIERVAESMGMTVQALRKAVGRRGYWNALRIVPSESGEELLTTTGDSLESLNQHVEKEDVDLDGQLDT